MLDHPERQYLITYEEQSKRSRERILKEVYVPFKRLYKTLKQLRGQGYNVKSFWPVT